MRKRFLKVSLDRRRARGRARPAAKREPIADLGSVGGPRYGPAMTPTWRHLPSAARPIAAAADAAVAAAQNHDREALAEAAGDLAALDPAQVGLILGTAVRLLLEDTHPDGLDGDDIRNVLERCARTAAGWQPDVEPHVLLILLAGALGVLDEDGQQPPQPDVLATNAALLLTDLLGPRSIRDYLTASLAEIERTQLYQ